MDLKDKLKEKGLDFAEEQVKSIVEGVFDFIEFTVKESENKYDDAVVAFLPLLKNLLLEQVDKIDGEIN